MLPQGIAFVNGKGGSGKCLHGRSLVTDPHSGVPHRLEDLVRRSCPDRVLSFDGSRVRQAEVSAAVDSGLQPCVRIDLASGRSVTVTLNHPMLLPDGWRRADEVQVGETVGVAARVPEPASPRRMADAELDLLAVLLAEGGTSGQSTQFSTADTQILELATRAAAQLGMNVRHDSRYDYTLTGEAALSTEPGWCACGCGTPTRVPARTVPSQGLAAGRPLRFVPHHGQTGDTTLRRLRRVHGLDGALARTKRLPEAVYRLPNDQLARFLAVFWMCDGYVSPTKGQVQLTLASESLLRALQHLLLRFGVQTRVRRRTTSRGGRSFASWELTVRAASLPAFAEAVPLWGQKADRLHQHQHLEVGASNPNVGAPSFAPPLRAALKGHCPPCGRKPAGGARLRDVAGQLGWRMPGKVPFDAVLSNPSVGGHRYVSPKALRAYCRAFVPTREFDWLTSEDLYWDRVVSVGDAGTQRVYDLTVPENANFLADDVIVHNTSVAANFGGLVADAGYRVLAVDMDPQGNLGRDLGYLAGGRSDQGHALFQAVTSGQELKPLRGVREGLDVVAGGEWLEDMAGTLFARGVRGESVTRAVGSQLAPLAGGYDLVLLDCPPGNRHLQQMALAAARFVVIPTRADDASLDGLVRVAELFRAVRDSDNPDLELLGVVLFGIGSRSRRIAAGARDTVAADLGDPDLVLEPTIRYVEAPAQDCRQRGQLVHELEASAASAQRDRLEWLRRRKAGKHRSDAEDRPAPAAASAPGLAQDYQDLAAELTSRITRRASEVDHG